MIDSFSFLDLIVGALVLCVILAFEMAPILVAWYFDKNFCVPFIMLTMPIGTMILKYIGEKW